MRVECACCRVRLADVVPRQIGAAASGFAIIRARALRFSALVLPELLRRAVERTRRLHHLVESF